MIHVVLPGMRKRRKGFIVNLSSIGGLRSFPALGYYNSTKFAVEGLSEALWQEVEPLGIKVMLVEPSGFRTDWAGRSANETKHPIDDYARTAHKNIQQLRAISGNQSGDPMRAAEAIVHAVESANPPHRLLLGKHARKPVVSVSNTVKAKRNKPFYVLETSVAKVTLLIGSGVRIAPGLLPQHHLGITDRLLRSILHFSSVYSVQELLTRPPSVLLR